LALAFEAKWPRVKLSGWFSIFFLLALVSLVSEVSGCGGKGVLCFGVVLQAANPSPARKVAINIRDLIWSNDIFKKDDGFGLPSKLNNYSV
jgi:hypothetical protein